MPFSVLHRLLQSIAGSHPLFCPF